MSALALGGIVWLAMRSQAPGWVMAALVTGWVLMPSILWASLSRPRLRYLLVMPAGAVTIGLVAMTVLASGTAAIGWLVLTVGVSSGGLFGMWFWYRWMPVPYALDDPYGMPRISLVGLHVGLVLIGGAIVLASL